MDAIREQLAKDLAALREKEAREKAEQEAREKAEKDAQWAAFKARIEGVNVYFANGGSEPNISDNDKAAIEELCIFLRDNKDYKVVVIGHTDNYGDPERNLKYYGMKRAEVMRDYMVRQGAPVEQIKCESKGQNEPVADNATSKGRALNRRANIRFE